MSDGGMLELKNDNMMDLIYMALWCREWRNGLWKRLGPILVTEQRAVMRIFIFVNGDDLMGVDGSLETR